MESVGYKLAELFIVFVLLPISFAFEFSLWIKLAIGFLGFAYLVYVLLKIEGSDLKLAPNLNWKTFWKHTLVKFTVIAFVTMGYVYFTDEQALFRIIVHKPALWLFVLFLYSVFSVYPQELAYRAFFFKRYEHLLKNKRQLMFLNAIMFSLGHLFFKNTLVLMLTFIGGLLLASTYNKTKSMVLVSIEHALYGCWLFTVGMGSMLGFPA